MNNKEFEKKQQKQKKAINIVKWCCLGLLGGLLAFGFFGLLAVGVKGCVSKQQLKHQQESAQVFIPKALVPNKTITATNNTNASIPYNSAPDAPFWIFMGSSTENVHQSAIYTWESGVNEEPDWSFYPGCYVRSNVAFASLVVEDADGTHTYNNIKYIGCSNDGMVFSNLMNPSSTTNTNTYLLSQQSMSEQSGIVSKFTLTTRDFFTLEYINSNQITINEYYYYSNGTQYHWWYRFLEGTKQNYFSVSNSQPAYVNSGSNTELGGVFGLLYQAFSSLASIMNLQVFTGITLGTFIFIPLVVGLIFFIVNLFKR